MITYYCTTIHYHDIVKDPSDVPNMIKTWGSFSEETKERWKSFYEAGVMSEQKWNEYNKAYEDSKENYGNSKVVMAVFEDGFIGEESYHRHGRNNDGDRWYFWSKRHGEEHGEVVGWFEIPDIRDMKEI